MAEGNVYRITRVVGSSDSGVDEAIRAAVGRASRTLRNLDWFEVKEIRGFIEDDAPRWFQVTLDIGFRVEDDDDDDDDGELEETASVRAPNNASATLGAP